MNSPRWTGFQPKTRSLRQGTSYSAKFSWTNTSGVDQALTATDDQRANQALPDAYAANKNIRQWLNPAAFAQPALGTYGNMNPGTVRAPGFFGIDTSVTRRFNLTERQSFELRGEAFNILNHVNPGQPVSTFSSSTFGQIQSASDPRILQMALKLIF